MSILPKKNDNFTLRIKRFISTYVGITDLLLDVALRHGIGRPLRGEVVFLLTKMSAEGGGDEVCHYGFPWLP